MFKISSIDELESFSQKVKWQYFEKLVAFVFSENGFDVEQNVVVVKNKKKRQFDVIAKRFGKTYLIECKKWKKSSESAIKSAVKQHKERCVFYGQAVPLIVTLTDVETDAEMPVVPILKLNAYINEEL